jgi:hypothetical protein
VHFFGGGAWVEMRMSVHRILQLLRGMIKLSAGSAKDAQIRSGGSMRVGVPADVTLADVLG